MSELTTLSATWTTVVDPHDEQSCSSVWGMWSHGSGFKSHLHPSLASYMTSPCLSFYTSQHMTFSPCWAGGGEVRSRVCKALAGSLTLKAALRYVQCPHVSVGTWEGLTNWSPPGRPVGHTGHLLKLAFPVPWVHSGPPP